MARTEISMPQLGETVTEGTITRWLKRVGEEVAADDLLFEVSTDKVDSEVPSPESGFLVEILVQEGETVEVGTPIAVLGDSAGEAGDAAPAEAQEEAEPEPEPKAEAEPEAKPEPEPEPEAEPAAAAEPQPEPAPEPEPEPEPEKPREPAPAAQRQEPARTAPAPSGEGLLLSPVVRRLMAEYDVDPSDVQGSGEGGRITRNDVLAHIESRRDGRGDGQAAAAAAPAPAPERAPAREEAPAERPAARPARPAGETEVVPMSNIRKRTAEHMVRSKATSPHVMMSVEVDFENVERVRAAHREEWREEEGFSLTYLPFIARAVCDALADFPNVNASVDGDNLVVHGDVNLAFAVDLNFEGLIVPVVKHADSLRLRHLAREVRELAERARSKRLSPDEVTGGTYTITNPGPFGTFLSAPVINQPQVAILSTEGVKKRPVVIEGNDGDAIAVHHVGYLSQSFDHRAFDGAYCAAYLARLKEIIETRDWETELA